MSRSARSDAAAPKASLGRAIRAVAVAGIEWIEICESQELK